MTKLSEQVAEFHRAFDVPCPSAPAVPGAERVDLRLRLIAEEFCELLEASGVEPMYVGCLRNDIARCLKFWREQPAVSIVAVADALADLDYVIEGTRLEFGINGEPIANEVHRSNMAKLGGPVVNGKIQKPFGWTAPDIAGELRRQGWVP